MANGPFDLGGLTLAELSKRIWSEVNDDNAWDAAAQLGYYFLLALFPLLICLLSFVALVPGVDLVEPVMATLRGVMPGQAFELMGREIERILTSSSGGLFTFGMIGTVWAASSGVASLIGTLNRAYEATETRSYFKLRAVSVALTFALVFLLCVGAFLLVAGDRVIDWAASWLGLAFVTQVIGTAINYAFGLGMMFLALELVYYFGPCIPDQKWRWVSPGSIAGVALFVLSSVAFSLYLRFNDTYSATYGSIGAVIVLMLWLYLLGLAIVIGAEANSEIAREAKRRGHPEAPETNVGTARAAFCEEQAAEGSAKGVKPARPSPGPEPAVASRPTPREYFESPELARYLGAKAGSASADDLVLRDLVSALSHENARVRAGAAMALGHRRPTDPAILDLLVSRLVDDDLDVREQAVRALGRVGEPATPSLTRAAASDDAEMRRVAEQALEAIRPAA